MPVVMAAALAAFFALLALLSLQMRAGADPAVKPSAAPEIPRIVVKRRIVKTRIIITDAPRSPSGGSPSLPTGAPVTASAPAAAPVRSAPAPIVSAAPAPPPPPAPVTRTS
jgi:hypothetical protein